MRQRSIEEIEELIAQYRNRGDLSRREFCEGRRISLSTLDYYLRRYGRTPAGMQLARVRIEKPQPAAATFALVLSNGRRIECGADALAVLLRVAEQA